MRGADGTEWERRYKLHLARGFRRSRWSFEGVMAQAVKRLSSEEFEYARLLAEAFLDETKVTQLEQHPRWKALRAWSGSGEDSAAGASPT